MSAFMITLEEPRGIDVTLLDEGATQVVFERGGRRTTLPAHEVVRVVRDDAREKPLLRLEALLAHGELEAAEREATQLLGTRGLPAWAAARAASCGASARLLRTRLEGTGAAQALAWCERALTLAGTSRLVPRATLAVGEAALLAGDVARVRAAFTRLAEGDLAVLPPWRHLGRAGLGRVLAREGKFDEAEALLEALEREAETDAFATEAAMQARIDRARARLARRDRQGAIDLLEPLRESPEWAHSPLLARALNTLADAYLEVAGRGPDGTWQGHGILAGMPLRLRVVRYALSPDQVERATALAAGAVALRLTGQDEIADMFEAELRTRFPTAAAIATFLGAPRLPGE